VLGLARFASSPARRALVVAALVLFATPATWQIRRQEGRTAPDRMPAPMVRAMGRARRGLAPGEVVLQRPGGRWPPAPSSSRPDA
jgi:hypothetical protein